MKHILINRIKFPYPDIQKNLEDKEYFLSFYLTDEKTFIFLVTENDFKQFEINSGRDEVIKLKDNISPYFNAEGKNQDAFYNQDLFSFNAKEANRFYNVILKNIFAEIPDGEQNYCFTPGRISFNAV